MEPSLRHLHLVVNGKIKSDLKDISKSDAESFVKDLLIATDMKALGPLIWSSAEDLDFPGQSFVQMITTSHCSLHYFSDVNEIYFDLYSCKDFNPEKVVELINSYFGLVSYHGIVYKRERSKEAVVSTIGKW